MRPKLHSTQSGKKYNKTKLKKQTVNKVKRKEEEKSFIVWRRRYGHRKWNGIGVSCGSFGGGLDYLTQKCLIDTHTNSPWTGQGRLRGIRATGRSPPGFKSPIGRSYIALKFRKVYTIYLLQNNAKEMTEKKVLPYLNALSWE